LASVSQRLVARAVGVALDAGGEMQTASVAADMVVQVSAYEA